MTEEDYFTEHFELTQHGVALALHALRDHNVTAAVNLLDELWSNLQMLRLHRHAAEDAERVRLAEWFAYRLSRRDPNARK